MELEVVTTTPVSIVQALESLRLFDVFEDAINDSDPLPRSLALAPAQVDDTNMIDFDDMPVESATRQLSISPPRSGSGGVRDARSRAQDAETLAAGYGNDGETWADDVPPVGSPGE